MNVVLFLAPCALQVADVWTTLTFLPLVGKLTITGNIIEDCVVVMLAHGTRSSSKGIVNCVFASISDVTGGGAITGNTIKVESGFSTASSYEGIKCAEGSVVSDNIIEIATTSSEYAITCPSASSSTPGAVVKNNIIRSANLAGAIRMWGGSYNNFVIGNYTQQSISSPGANNTATGNYTIK